MSARTLVLVVDDEPQIRRLLRTSLSAHDYGVIEAETGANAIRLATTRNPELIILDLGLPDMDGQEVIARVREWSATPIIVLSVRDDELEKVQALDGGANDYVTKPFGMEELMARMRSAQRLSEASNGDLGDAVRTLGDIEIDLGRRQVRRSGDAVQLSPKEYELLRQLVTHAGRVLTHRQLLKSVWGPAQVNETQYLRVYIAQLRQKLEANPADPRLILTEPGVGYRMVEAEQATGMDTHTRLRRP